jgi:hypothetical protein
VLRQPIGRHEHRLRVAVLGHTATSQSYFTK